MIRFLKSSRFLIATLAVLVGAGWVAVTEEQYFQAPIRVNAQAYFTTPISYSHNTSTLTALASGGPTGATLLTKEFNVVTTVATAGDSVKLPVAYRGAHVMVYNADSADAVAVFPNTGATIDTASANASISIAAGQTIEFWGISATAWRSSTSLPTTNVLAGVTAATGSAQGDGPITAYVTQVTTVGTAGDCLTLPVAVPGRQYIVANHAASNAMDLFPASGDRINKETANAAISLAAGEGAVCTAVDTTYWLCVIGSAN